MAWPDAGCRRGHILAVPLGATEQHGPHLPLTTDTEIAVAIVAGLARMRDDVVAAPAMPYGSSGEHDGFAGTVSIGREATELALVELCRSASASFDGILLVSAHGGNAECVAAVQQRMGAERRSVRVWSPQWGAAEHAGRCETSLMLALAPERVAIERAVAGDRRPVSALLPALRAGGVRAVSDNGVLGDPADASAEEGRRLLAAAVVDVVAAVEGWSS